jgi:hypothetical protein
MFPLIGVAVAVVDRVVPQVPRAPSAAAGFVAGLACAVLSAVSLCFLATPASAQGTPGEAALSDVQLASHTHYSEQEIGAMFDRPTSVEQLARNLKIAAERDLLWQPAFAADANLMKFFNGSAVRRVPVSGSETVLDTDQEDAFVTVNTEYFPRMTIRVREGLDKHPEGGQRTE